MKSTLPTIGTLVAGLLTLAFATHVAAATHTVAQAGFTFSPQALNVAAGDTVVWTWNSDSHTVTSGTGPEDPAAGDLFDAPLTATNPSFSYVFGSAGTFPYFCRPHFLLGMTGTVEVEPGVPAETTNWGSVKRLFR
ncbi:MAG: plastocyanin/azurin family copper-binding protein [Candidatus Krumholzibacteriia bacterium]